MSALVVKNFGEVALSITAEAELRKAQALEKGKAIVEVSDKEGMAVVTAAIADIKSLIKAMKVSKDEVKRPVIDLGRKIEEIAKAYEEALLAEGTRLNTLLQDFYAAEEKKAEVARNFNASLAKKRQDAEDKRAKEAQEEADRLKEQAQSAETVQEALELQEQAQTRERESEEASARAQTVVAKPVAEAPRVEKMIVRKIWKHQVLDIHALYKARPELCKIEPKTALINAALAGGDRDIPGLRDRKSVV